MNDRENSGPQHIFRLAIPIIQVLGIAMIVSGIVIITGWSNILPPEAGIIILVMGVIEFLAVPAILRNVQNSKSDNFLEGARPGNKDGR
ncbi:hypothetical protein [Parasphingorhabdus halotolerans]|uniref:Uncharacterized protein n=1 Tax=Parasphingorhabdus halotolerans TaxID=2725558 RepID=A0A6H2DR27_9SPHN|nr:hypothetical protein [Parasphingorhabdus halotolerans]QJB70433.1 hypothetical protein HF685_15135 [Parasphingorhabdus halotolerans]